MHTTRFGKSLFRQLRAAGLLLWCGVMSSNMELPAVHAQTPVASRPSVPELAVPEGLEAWKTQREAIRSTLLHLLGDLPPRPSVPSAVIDSQRDMGDVILEKVSIDNGMEKVPGFLFRPKNVPQKRLPAILYCHWHGGQYDQGKQEMLLTNVVPETPGPALARLGYVVLGVDAPCFGERNGRLPYGLADKGGAGELTASKVYLWEGRTLWGMMLRDDLIALDYLCSRGDVDRERIGVTGISMGATRTWWLMALDERLRCGSAVDCLTRAQDLIATKAVPAHGIYYFVPGLLRHFDNEAVVALIAPRSILFQTGDSDSGSPVSGIRTIEAVTQKVYALYGQNERFKSMIYPNTGHVYTPEMWKQTKAWLESHLNPK
jgi:dienelactone hydrolase